MRSPETPGGFDGCILALKSIVDVGGAVVISGLVGVIFYQEFKQAYNTGDFIDVELTASTIALIAGIKMVHESVIRNIRK